MLTIEQVELLEAKVSKAVDYIRRLTSDKEKLRGVSDRLTSENEILRSKIERCQKQNADLEAALLGFKQDQERIEKGIISALDRLNHFEDAVDETEAGQTDGEPAGHPAAIGLVAAAENKFEVAIDVPEEPEDVSENDMFLDALKDDGTVDAPQTTAVSEGYGGEPKKDETDAAKPELDIF
jgi:FtsZ-binding cell division protein ZapB